MAEAELVDTLEDTTEVVRTSIGTWDTETDNVVDTGRADSCGTCDSESETVVYSKVVPTSIRVDTYGARDINFDSEEDIEMILTSIGTDAFELCNTDMDARHTAIGQFEEDIGMVPAAGIKGFQSEVDQMENTCEEEHHCTQIGLQSSEHVTEL